MPAMCESENVFRRQSVRRKAESFDNVCGRTADNFLVHRHGVQALPHGIQILQLSRRRLVGGDLCYIVVGLTVLGDCVRRTVIIEFQPRLGRITILCPAKESVVFVERTATEDTVDRQDIYRFVDCYVVVIRRFVPGLVAIRRSRHTGDRIAVAVLNVCVEVDERLGRFHQRDILGTQPHRVRIARILLCMVCILGPPGVRLQHLERITGINRCAGVDIPPFAVIGCGVPFLNDPGFKHLSRRSGRRRLSRCVRCVLVLIDILRRVCAFAGIVLHIDANGANQLGAPLCVEIQLLGDPWTIEVSVGIGVVTPFVHIFGVVFGIRLVVIGSDRLLVELRILRVEQ